ncbi:MAG: MFS transporter [Anaerolineae bacterium]|nr:MFS transporter [Anaerolineae bacterium]NUQ06494.1 MFS transporter [Anaerolineae bacterium]
MGNRRFHYAWVIVVVTFLGLLLSAGVRNATSVLFEPLEAHFGWDRASVSLAFAISLVFFGLGAPIGGTLIDRYGPRRVMIAGLATIAVGLALLLTVTELWQFHLYWGVVIGIGTGAVAGTLGSTVALRWFNQYRGLALGVFSSAAAAGQLLFLPALITLEVFAGWQGIFATLGILIAVILVPALFLMRNSPEEAKTTAIGKASAATLSIDSRATPMREALRTRDFWLLAGSFFVCGYTTIGLITTHLLPHSLEHGFQKVEISWAIAFMGAMNIIGTTASGWLTDRVDNRKLLALYYGMRAISLVALPFIYDMQNMLVFALVYGLDWVATVPPTVNLTAQRFGRKSLGSIYGWIYFSHMMGAGLASYTGGFFREVLGDYHLVFASAAILGLLAVTFSLSISISARQPKPAPQAA